MSATPIWFGPPQRPLFGWFHAPADGHARGGVVLCPPLSRDYLQAHYALRRVAVGLEQAGIAVVRFDYDGTGDSFGATDDPGRVDAWLASVAAAIEVLRRSGVTRIGLAGMRVGALLAAEAAARDGAVEQLVLWDPAASGKAFVSEQRALAALTFGTSPTHDDGSLETPGMLLGAETVAGLRALEIAATGPPLAARALVLTRAGRTPPRALAERLASSDTQWAEAVGQEELMDVGSPFQVLPDATISYVVAWFAGGAAAATVAIDPPAAAGNMVVGTRADGREVVETPTALGPFGLFAITTEIPGAVVGPTVMLLSVANEHHIGPNRLWVELARQWAALGMRCVRFDLSGLGDSPARPGQAEFVARAPDAFDDVADVAAAVSPEDPSNVYLVGLCSAAYQAIENALVLGPRGIIAVNPVLSFLPPEMLAGERMDERRRACLPRTSLVEKFHDDGPLAPLRRRFPNLGWSIRNFIARNQRPAVWLRELTAMGVEGLFVCGDREMRQIRQGMTSHTYARLTGTGHLKLEFIAGLDHGLLLSAHRTQVTAMMTAFLTARQTSQPAVRPIARPSTRPDIKPQVATS
jgi:alpha-beta hydrolase superfamily lysophospholipase